ncbi:hypothetical protein B0H14DRAFT_2740244, partial [Mycena olivaceomarginata]
MEKSSAAVKLTPLQPSIPNGAEQNIFTLTLLPSLSAILTDVTRIESTRVAWIHVDENEIYEMLRGNVALLVFNGDALTNFLIGRILESVVGTDSARRLRKLFPSIRELSQSLAAVHDTKAAWTACNNNDLSAFIFEILSRIVRRIPHSSSMIRLALIYSICTSDIGLADERKEWNTMLPNTFSDELILSENKIRTLTVTKIHEQLDKHRNDTLGADSRRQSAQLLDVMGLDELGLEKSDVGMGDL